MKRLILASASATRAKLLAAAGLDFEVVPASVDESAVKRAAIAAGDDAAAAARRLAAEKASFVAQFEPDAIVLGADQILNLDGVPVSKCRDTKEAVSMLRRLRGRTHELVTAAALAANGSVIWGHADICRMTMRCFSDVFLDTYISRAGAALVQCVGCYEFEGLGAQLFESVEGDFFSILGLPLLPLLAALREHDVTGQ